MTKNLITFKTALSGGELSPSVFGRTDLPKYHEGTSTCRNFFVDYRGGVQSRPGFVYVGQAKQCGIAVPPRLIPFQFNLDQGYCLEFGQEYVRFIFHGGYITEDPVAITGISQTNPAVVTSPSHGLSTGDWVFINDVVGMTELNDLIWVVGSVIDTDRFTLINLFDEVVDTTNYTSYTSGGTFARVYEVSSPYLAEDLPYLKYTQSADILTITCFNTETGTEYPPYDLKRFGNTDWTFTPVTFASNMVPPSNVTATAYSSNTISTWYSYVVTAVNGETGEESIASTPADIQNCDISIYAGTNTVSWSAVDGATSYNIYAATPSYGAQINSGNLYGFVGISFGTNFNDTNILPDFSTVPPLHADPFASGAIIDVEITGGGVNYSQSTIGYTITTSTGSGFVGTPVVTNGSLNGFVIQDPGSNYAPGDTIAFSDSGGGLASGFMSFTVNPPVESAMTLNGFLIRFVAPNGTLNGRSVQEGSTLDITLQNLSAFLNSSNNGNLNVATYQATATELQIVYKTPGIAGNSYTLNANDSGGTPSGATLTAGGTDGTGAAANLVVGPATGIYPATVAYFQQRRVFANSENHPDTYWMTQPGLFYNMDASIPSSGSDAITGSPFSQTVNGIQWLVPMPGGLVVLTGSGAWQVNGGSSAAITPADQTATPQAYNGCNALVQPLRINYDILYVQAKGTKVRDLSYNWWIQIYTGVDLTTVNNHLFDGHEILQWAWAEEPYKLVWAIRDDGVMLCLTFLKENDSNGAPASNIFSWTRHDTLGQFFSVCTVTEPPTDAVYVVVKRFIHNQWKFYIERMYSPVGQNGVTLQTQPENYVCHDCSLQTAPDFPVAMLYPSAATGTGVTFVTDLPVFTSDDVNKIIRADGGIGIITAYNNPQSVTVTITKDLTLLIPNSTAPLPVAAGNWNLLTTRTIVDKLNHIVGQTVSILADGSVVDNQVVTELSPGVFGVTLSEPASKITVGLPYVCQVQTLYIDIPETQETVQTRRKNISAVGVQVEATRGLQVGINQVDASILSDTIDVTWSRMSEIKEKPTTVGNAIPLFTGNHYKTAIGGWKEAGQIAFQQLYPLPAKILALSTYWALGDDKA